VQRSSTSKKCFHRTRYCMKTKKESPVDWLLVFSSSLGWITLLGGNDRVKELTFGHATRAAAKKALSSAYLSHARPLKQKSSLVYRLQGYAKGARDDFHDIPVDLRHLTAFQRRVFSVCRKIPYGSTLTYGRLAALAGSPGAYRAVGNCLASNKIPLIIPCHRVVAAGGRIGSYSACGGVKMKKRLLALEKRAEKRAASLKN
jgi:methylated-DNA-[protein]-cysteine S-methyltransferase